MKKSSPCFNEALNVFGPSYFERPYIHFETLEKHYNALLYLLLIVSNDAKQIGTLTLFLNINVRASLSFGKKIYIPEIKSMCLVPSKYYSHVACINDQNKSVDRHSIQTKCASHVYQHLCI